VTGAAVGRVAYGDGNVSFFHRGSPVVFRRCTLHLLCAEGGKFCARLGLGELGCKRLVLEELRGGVRKKLWSGN
jgi:hypothetical protein